jgi:hypothetical protein
MKYIKLYEDIDWDDWNEEEKIELIFDLDNKIYSSVEDFKINDRVEFIFKNKSYFATIIYYKKNHYLTLEFDDYIDGHNGGVKNKGKQGHCWNIFYENNKLDFELNFDGIKERLNKI